jgi:hypothetical protein
MAGVYSKSRPHVCGDVKVMYITCVNIAAGGGDTVEIGDATLIHYVGNIGIAGVNITWSGTTLTLISTAGTEDGVIKVEYV